MFKWHLKTLWSERTNDKLKKTARWAVIGSDIGFGHMVSYKSETQSQDDRCNEKVTHSVSAEINLLSKLLGVCPYTHRAGNGGRQRGIFCLKPVR